MEAAPNSSRSVCLKASAQIACTRVHAWKHERRCAGAAAWALRVVSRAHSAAAPLTFWSADPTCTQAVGSHPAHLRQLRHPVGTKVEGDHRIAVAHGAHCAGAGGRGASQAHHTQEGSSRLPPHRGREPNPANLNFKTFCSSGRNQCCVQVSATAEVLAGELTPA